MSAQQMNGHGLPGVMYLQARDASGVDTSVSMSVDQSDSWTIVEVEGEMDVQVIALLASLTGNETPRVVLDLREVSYLNALGLGAMLDTRLRMLESGGCVRLAAPSRRVRRLLTLTGCDRMFRTFDSREEAVTTPIDTDLELDSSAPGFARHGGQRRRGVGRHDRRGPSAE